MRNAATAAREPTVIVDREYVAEITRYMRDLALRTGTTARAPRWYTDLVAESGRDAPAPRRITQPVATVWNSSDGVPVESFELADTAPLKRKHLK